MKTLKEEMNLPCVRHVGQDETDLQGCSLVREF